jgi:hypothetical protein
MRLPFLKNFRRGFATNSSSSHSFVYLKEPRAGELGGPVYQESFGWEDFRLDTLKEKLFYALVSRIGGGWQVTEADIDEHFEEHGSTFPELTREDFTEAAHSYVDHDSVGLISPDDARDPHLVVFGGNDNGGDSQERARAVASGEIDWERSEMLYEDADHLPLRDDPAAAEKRANLLKRGY